MSSSSAHYSPAARHLHWLIAILILSTFPAGVIMTQEGLDRSVQDGLFIYHKNIGVIIFLLMTVRIVYRIFNPPPPLPASMPSAQKTIAHVSHWLLYVLVFVMTISGYVRVKAGGFPIEWFDAIGVPSLVPRSDAIAETAKGIHGTARFALFFLVMLHILAAAYHGIIRRDGIFSRMWKGAPAP